MSCPDHYKLTTLFRKDGSPAEVIDICDELAPEDPNQFQAIEYLLRCKKKGQLESDLEKCKFYIDRMLQKLQGLQVSSYASKISGAGELLYSCYSCKYQENLLSFGATLGNPCIGCLPLATHGTKWEPKP